MSINHEFNITFYIKNCKFLNCTLSGFLGGGNGLDRMFNCIYENCHFKSYWHSYSNENSHNEAHIRFHLKKYLILSLEDTDILIKCKITAY